MGDKWDVHDEYGRKIGTVERQPSAVEQVAGTFILFWLVFKILEGIFTLIALTVKFLFKHPKFTLSLTALGVLAMVYHFGIYIPSKEREAQQAAAVRASAQAAQQAKVEKGLAFLQGYQGMLDISFTASDDRGRYVTVKSVEFMDDGIKVYVEAVVNSYTGPWNSCVTFTREDRNGANWIRPPKHEFKKLNDTPGKDHFVGYAYYPRRCTRDTCPDSSLPYDNSQNKYLDFWIIPERVSGIADTTLYFKYECTWGSAAIRLFDFADFANR